MSCSDFFITELTQTVIQVIYCCQNILRLKRCKIPQYFSLDDSSPLGVWRWRVTVCQGQLEGFIKGIFRMFRGVEAFIGICLNLQLLGKPLMWERPRSHGVSYVRVQHTALQLPTAFVLSGSQHLHSFTEHIKVWLHLRWCCVLF